MLFNSTTYLIFLLVVVWLYYQLTPFARRTLILIASYTFYWAWSIPFSLLLLGSTLIDYAAARIIASSDVKRVRNTGLLLSIVFNLGVLCLFKYFDFFTNSAYSLFGVRVFPELDLILPLGISFYTFQTMSYTIDVYRGQMQAKKSILDVALYVSFFPQLVAGPIVRSDVLMPQLSGEERHLDWGNIRRGIGLVMWGLGKKVYVADAMAHIANEVFGNPEVFGCVDLIMGTYAFAVQIYCDFSGYSDIAIGSALLLGIRIPKNFDHPYLSCSLQEFWRRWHISLSTWLRDYLYIPLGGNRKGVKRTYLNLLVTMLIGGLWHGAGWNWVVWGGFHGVVLSIERVLDLPERAKSVWGNGLRWLITLNLVSFSWVLFRSQNMEKAVYIYKKCFTLSDGSMTIGLLPILYLLIIVLIERLNIREQWLAFCEEYPSALKWLVYCSVVVLIFTFAGVKNPEFIYFQF